MDIVLNGLKFGLALAILVGPVFFTIIQTSVEKGFSKGALVALGVSVSDMVCVLVCYFGLVQFLNDPGFKRIMPYVGGGILIAFGLYYLIIKGKKQPEKSSMVMNETGSYRYMLKGFLINGLSPSVILFWIATSSVATLQFGYTKGIEFFTFFGTMLAVCLTTDILKAYLADKLGSVMTPRVIMIMNILLGIGMIAFGLKLILKNPLV